MEYGGGRKTVVDFRAPQGTIRHLKATLYRQSFSRSDGSLASGAVVLLKGIDAEVEATTEASWQRHVLNLVGDFVFVKDAEGRLRYANDSFETVFELGDWQTPHVDRSLVLESWRDAYDTAQALLCRDGTWSGYLRRLAPDGSVLVLECSWRQVEDLYGKADLYLYIEREISGEGPPEGQSQSETRLDDMGLMIHGALHDLNNALGPAVLAADLIEDRDIEASSVGLMNVVRKQLTSATNIGNSVQRYLSGAELQASRFDLNGLATSVFATVERTFPDTITTGLRLYPAALLVDSVDIYVNRILINLLVNARDALLGEQEDELSGTIELATGHWPNGLADQSAAQTWNYLPDEGAPCGWISVSDSGPGISPEMMPRVFDPYFTTKREGTGIGLFMVRSMVERLGGALSIDQRTEGGCAITLAIPLVGGSVT